MCIRDSFTGTAGSKHGANSCPEGAPTRLPRGGAAGGACRDAAPSRERRKEPTPPRKGTPHRGVEAPR
eukprot:12725902-Alexandrium_andersonii.AAC.1